MEWIQLKQSIKNNPELSFLSDVEDFDDCVGVFVPFENISLITSSKNKEEQISEIIKKLEKNIPSIEVDFDELPAGFNFVIA